jgi:protein transport protein SEC39
VSKDPIGLINKVLEQNPRSYTKLDDLIGIGQNLVTAGLSSPESDGISPESSVDLEASRKDAERRVTFMAMEAALREDDFETAYSYIISRLTPSVSDIEVPKDDRKDPTPHKRNLSKSSTRSSAVAADDDISWRAAFLAGRYRPASASPPSLRRLEQRTELLSLALLLAPVSALTEILAAWRRCEEEMTSLQLAQQSAEEDFDDRADKRQSMTSLPGNFTVQDDQPAMILNQQRREMGRMTGKSGEGDAPLSMFDLTRSAAQTFSRNAFPLRGVAKTSTGLESMESSVKSYRGEAEGDAQQRVRKRDYVANAVSGGLASGIGWMLGATPVSQQQQQQQQQERDERE